MMKLCSMASLGSPSGFVLHQDQGYGRAMKECERLVPTSEAGHNISRPGSLNLRPHQFEDSWKPISGLFESNKFVNIDSRPVLIDAQAKDVPPSSLLFGYDIAENCTKHDKILQYLSSGSSEVENEGLDLSLLSELMGLPMISSDTRNLQFDPLLNYRSSELDAQKPIVDFMGDIGVGSKVIVQPDGRVLFTGTGNEMKDLLSLISEFYSSKDLTICRKRSLLVPYFDRLDGGQAQTIADLSSLTLEALTVAPLKSPEKVKFNPTHKKKKNKKHGRDRDLYKKNGLHACEALLSLIADRTHHGKMAIRNLKKSGPELPELLTQFSAGIAGTGLAVLFSVACRVACGRAPLPPHMLLSTGVGFALVWLASGVNKLRDTIVRIGKSPRGLGMVKEEEMARNLDSSMKEIYFRAAALLAVAVLRLA